MWPYIKYNFDIDMYTRNIMFFLYLLNFLSFFILSPLLSYVSAESSKPKILSKTAQTATALAICSVNGRHNPAGTWHLYNVASTSMQRHRHDITSTLMWRFINVMCPLGNIKHVSNIKCLSALLKSNSRMSTRLYCSCFLFCVGGFICDFCSIVFFFFFFFFFLFFVFLIPSFVTSGGLSFLPVALHRYIYTYIFRHWQ